MISPIKIAECYVNKAKNAKLRSIKFDMSLLTFSNIKNQSVCAYSGLPFDDTEHGSLSLERIDNSIGYIDGNVIPVRREYNTLRGDLTSETIDKRIAHINSVIMSKEVKKRFHFDAITADRTVSMLKQMVANPVEVNTNKPRIAKAQFARWKKYAETLHNTQNALDYRLKLIAETELLILGKKGVAPGKKKMKSLKRLLEVHSTKAESLKSAIAGAEKALFKFYKNNCKTSNDEPLNLLRTSLPERATNIEFHEEQISVLSKELEKHYESILALKQVIKPALIKFENLSAGEKERICLGLPLNTTMYSLLKHKIGYNCIINMV